METRKVGELEFGHVSPAQKKCLGQLERMLQQAIELGITSVKVLNVYRGLLRRADMATLRYLAGQEHLERIEEAVPGTVFPHS